MPVLNLNTIALQKLSVAEADKPEHKANIEALRVVPAVDSAQGGDKKDEDPSDAVEVTITPLQDDEREFKPLWLCRVICTYPAIYFGIGLFYHLSLVGVTLALYFNGNDIFPTNFEHLPLDVKDSHIYLKQTAWLHREDSNILYKRDAHIFANKSAQRTTPYQMLNTYFIYQSRDNNTNILTKKNFDTIAAIENDIFTEKKYQEEFCYVAQDRNCKKPHSILRLFDGTFERLNPVFNDKNFTSIASVLTAASKFPNLLPYLQLLGKNLKNNNFSNSLLSIHFYGLPLKNFTYTKDSDKKQHNIIRGYLVDTWLKTWDNFTEQEYEGLKIYTRNLALYFYRLNKQILLDSYLMIGSFTFIFLFAWIQTGSLWLSLWGILNTCFSFVAGNLVYNLVFDFKYIGGFHLVSVFIILGIAADNLFIFCDTWKSLRRYSDVSVRLSYCYSRAAKSMLVTSLTTAAAFLLNSFSSILAMSAFGAFSGIVVLVNYLYIITFYPVIIVIWHDKFEHRCNSCHGNKVDSSLPPNEVIDCKQKTTLKCTITPNVQVVDYKQTTTEKHKENIPNCDANSDVIEKRKIVKTITRVISLTKQHSNKDDEVDCQQTKKETSKTEERCRTIESERLVVRFLAGPYFRFMSKPIVQGFVIALFVFVMATTIYFASNIVSDDRKPRAMKSDHPMEQFDDVLDENFDAGLANPYGKLYIVWGLREQNMSKCHSRKYDNCLGESTWNPNFDLNPAPAQKHLLDFCERMNNMTKTQLDSLKIRSINGKPAVKCFIEEMDSFYKKINRQYSIPMSETKTRLMMRNNPRVYNVSQLPDVFYRYFETAYAYWITNGHSSSAYNENYKSFADLVGEEGENGDEPDVTSIKTASGNNLAPAFFGTRLRFAAIEVELHQMHPHQTNYKKGLKVYQNWEKFLKKEVSRMPAPLQDAFQTTTFEWHWFHMQNILCQQAILSVTLGVLVAWIVLVVSSGNWVVGTMAMIIIATICACVMGVISLAGWKYGLLEAMNTTLVVGLAVDYVVHLGVAYNKSKRFDRSGRVQHALREYGISVLSGAATTLGSSFFMFFAKVSFFSQFGSFMFATIGFAIVFALTVFIVMLLLIGPQGKTGSNDVIVHFVVRKVFSTYLKKKYVLKQLSSF